MQEKSRGYKGMKAREGKGNKGIIKGRQRDEGKRRKMDEDKLKQENEGTIR